MSMNKHFKAIRRDSIKLEVDGLWDEFEEEEDSQTEVQEPTVSHSECLMLQRVLTDKSKIPYVCGRGQIKMMSHNEIIERPNVPFARRLSGAYPGAFNEQDDLTLPAEKNERLGGKISYQDCQSLSSYLSPSVGGMFLLPNACTQLLKRGEEERRTNEVEKETETQQNEVSPVFNTLQRRLTEMGKEEVYSMID